MNDLPEALAYGVRDLLAMLDGRLSAGGERAETIKALARGALAEHEARRSRQIVPMTVQEFAAAEAARCKLRIVGA